MLIRPLAVLALGLLAACEPAAPDMVFTEECTPLYTRNTVVQISDITLGPQNSDGLCRISGTVQRVFNGAATVGQPISAQISCTGPLAEVGLGGTAFDSDAIRAATFAELHIRPDGEVEADYGYFQDGFEILTALTDDRVARGELCEMVGRMP